jgi:hypothetical protein
MPAFAAQPTRSGKEKAMKSKQVHSTLILFSLLTILVAAGCSPNANQAPPTEPAAAENPSPPPAVIEETSTPVEVHENELVVDENILLQDDFTNPTSGWPEEKFDNYFIGYHEPEYYHVEITSPNYRTVVFEPEKRSFSDVTIEVKVFAVGSRTAPEGDLTYGLAFRRSGDQYYAFTISPRTKKWFVLKSTPNALIVLSEGSEEGIHDLDGEDILRVDAQDADFSFHINDRLVTQVSDSEFMSGEVGLYAQTFDSANTHIHFDSLIVRNFDAPSPQASGQALLYEDDFTNPTSGWPDKKFDNYFIGYHEPEYYHVEITSPNYRTVVFEPEKRSFSDVTIEVKVFAVGSRTAPEGDLTYGLAFRRSGDQYYAFTISPRTKKWFVLKSTPNALIVLSEGSEEGIHDLDGEDILRVDAQGSDFSFHINDRLVAQVSDSEFMSGEVGLYAQTFDSANTHIHFDSLIVRNFDAPLVCTVKAMALNVRDGPGTDYASASYLTSDDIVQPLAISPDGEWIKITVEGSEGQGWVFNSEGFLSCNSDLYQLPTISP